MPGLSQLSKVERALLARLGSSDSDARYRAYLDAQDLSPERLLALATYEAERTDRRRRIMSGLGRAGCLIWIALIVVILASKSLPVLLRLSLAILPGLVFVSMFADLAANQRSTFRIRNLCRLIQEQRDVRFIGPALMMRYTSSRDIMWSVERTLLRLLPELREGDTKDWTPEQKAALIRLLKSYISRPELTLCAVRAIHMTRMVEAIDEVEKLAAWTSQEVAALIARYVETMRHLSHNSRDLERRLEQMERAQAQVEMDRLGYVLASNGPVIQRWSSETSVDVEEIDSQELEARVRQIVEAARECLAVLRERAEVNRQSQTLLRAATGEAQPETLLRSAAGSPGNIPASELLRSKNPQQSDGTNGAG